MSELIITDNLATGWARDANRAFPIPWTSDVAALPGGARYGVFRANGANLETINLQLIDAWQSARIQTATGAELDLVAQDFLGNALPRQLNETDDSYRVRIVAALFLPYTTKPCFETAIANQTGVDARVIDGWSTGDCGAYDYAYYDGDSADTPALYMDPGSRYQGFVIATLPVVVNPNLYPLYGYDLGAYYDSWSGSYYAPNANQFAAIKQLDALINRIKAEGMTIWRKYLNPQTAATILAKAVTPPPGGNGVYLQTFKPFAVPYFVLLSGTWNSVYFVDAITAVNFFANTSVDNPTGGIMFFSAIPNNIPGVGNQFLTEGVSVATINKPTNALSPWAAVSPSWDTNVWITTASSGLIDVAFNNPAPPDAVLNYYFFPSTQADQTNVPTNAYSILLPITQVKAVNPYVLPSWNTQVSVQVLNGLVGSVSVPSGTLSLAVPVQGFDPVNDLVIVSPSWNAQLALDSQNGAGFNLRLNIGGPAAGSLVNYLVFPAAAANGGQLNSMTAGAVTATIPIPAGYTNCAVAFTPSWLTNVYVESIDTVNVYVRFTTPVPSGAKLNYYFFASNQGGIETVTAGTRNVSIAAEPGYVPFATTTWNSQNAVTISGEGDIVVQYNSDVPADKSILYASLPPSQAILAEFDTAAPASAFVQWGYVPRT